MVATKALSLPTVLADLVNRFTRLNGAGALSTTDYIPCLSLLESYWAPVSPSDPY
jgi:hypothetical protein